MGNIYSKTTKSNHNHNHASTQPAPETAPELVTSSEEYIENLKTANAALEAAQTDLLAARTQLHELHAIIEDKDGEINALEAVCDKKDRKYQQLYKVCRKSMNDLQAIEAQKKQTPAEERAMAEIIARQKNLAEASQQYIAKQDDILRQQHETVEAQKEALSQAKEAIGEAYEALHKKHKSYWVFEDFLGDARMIRWELGPARVAP